mgnify:CR=1 FL=1
MFKRINFQSIPVEDQQRALEFYRDKLGFNVQTDAPYEEGWRWIFMQIPGAETMLHFGSRGDMEHHKGPALCLVTDDVDAEAKRLESLGVAMKNGPGDAPWQQAVRFAMFDDSEDNLVLMQSSTMET